jgi:hypothetical protein
MVLLYRGVVAEAGNEIRGFEAGIISKICVNAAESGLPDAREISPVIFLKY